MKRAAGDRVRLECVSSGGNPVPQIEWRRNGRPLPEGQSVSAEVLKRIGLFLAPRDRPKSVA